MNLGRYQHALNSESPEIVKLGLHELQENILKEHNLSQDWAKYGIDISDTKLVNFFHLEHLKECDGILKSFYESSPQLQEFFSIWDLSSREFDPDLCIKHISCINTFLICLQPYNNQLNVIVNRIYTNYSNSIFKQLQSKNLELRQITIVLLNTCLRISKKIPNDLFSYIMNIGVGNKALIDHLDNTNDKPSLKASILLMITMIIETNDIVLIESILSNTKIFKNILSDLSDSSDITINIIFNALSHSLASNSKFRENIPKVLVNSSIIEIIKLSLSENESKKLLAIKFLHDVTQIILDGIKLNKSENKTSYNKHLLSCAQNILDNLSPHIVPDHSEIELELINGYPPLLKKSISLLKLIDEGQFTSDFVPYMIHWKHLLDNSNIELVQNVSQELNRNVISGLFGFLVPQSFTKKDFQKALTSETSPLHQLLSLDVILSLLNRIYKQFFPVFQNRGLRIENLVSEVISEIFPDIQILYSLRGKFIDRIQAYRTLKASQTSSLLEFQNKAPEEDLEMDLDLNIEIDQSSTLLNFPSSTKNDISMITTQETIEKQLDSSLQIFFQTFILWNKLFPLVVSKSKFEFTKFIEDLIELTVNESTQEISIQMLPIISPETLDSLIELLISNNTFDLIAWFGNEEDNNKLFNQILVTEDWKKLLKKTPFLKLLMYYYEIKTKQTENSVSIIQNFIMKIMLRTNLFQGHGLVDIELSNEASLWITSSSEDQLIILDLLIRFSFSWRNQMGYRLHELVSSSNLKYLDHPEDISTQSILSPFSPVLFTALCLVTGDIENLMQFQPKFIRSYFMGLCGQLEGEKTHEQCNQFFQKFNKGFRHQLEKYVVEIMFQQIVNVRAPYQYVKILLNVVSRLSNRFSFQQEAYLRQFDKFSSLISSTASSSTSIQPNSLPWKDEFVIKNFKQIETKTLYESFITMFTNWDSLIQNKLFSSMKIFSDSNLSKSQQNNFEKLWKHIILSLFTSKSLKSIPHSTFKWIQIKLQTLPIQTYQTNELLQLFCFMIQLLFLLNNLLLNEVKRTSDFQRKDCSFCFELSDYLCELSIQLLHKILINSTISNQKDLYLIQLLLTPLIVNSFTQENAFAMICRMICSEIFIYFSQLTSTDISSSNFKLLGAFYCNALSLKILKLPQESTDQSFYVISDALVRVFKHDLLIRLNSQHVLKIKPQNFFLQLPELSRSKHAISFNDPNIDIIQYFPFKNWSSIIKAFYAIENELLKEPNCNNVCASLLPKLYLEENSIYYLNPLSIVGYFSPPIISKIEELHPGSLISNIILNFSKFISPIPGLVLIAEAFSNLVLYFDGIIQNEAHFQNYLSNASLFSPLLYSQECMKLLLDFINNYSKDNLSDEEIKFSKYFASLIEKSVLNNVDKYYSLKINFLLLLIHNMMYNKKIFLKNGFFFLAYQAINALSLDVDSTTFLETLLNFVFDSFTIAFKQENLTSNAISELSICIQSFLSLTNNLQSKYNNDEDMQAFLLTIYKKKLDKMVKVLLKNQISHYKSLNLFRLFLNNFYFFPSHSSKSSHWISAACLSSKDSAINPEIILRLLLSHSKLQDVLDNTNSKIKLALIKIFHQLLEILLQHNSSLHDSSKKIINFLYNTLSKIYNGTLFETDRILLNIFLRLETILKIPIYSLVPAFAKTIKSEYWMIDGLKLATTQETLNHFPLSRSIAQTYLNLDNLSLKSLLFEKNTQEKKFSWGTHSSDNIVDQTKIAFDFGNYSSEEIYDPAFLIPCILLLLRKKTILIRQLIASGCISILIMGLSSHCSVMRLYSLYSLQLVFELIEKQNEEVDPDFKERPQIMQYLEFIKNAITYPEDPNEASNPFILPATSALYLSKAFLLCMQPRNDMYLKMSIYMIGRPMCDSKDVPLYDLILMQSDINQDANDRLVTLRMLRDGLKTHQDHLNMCRKNAYSRLLTMFPLFLDPSNSSQDHQRSANVILDIFEAAANYKESMRYLIERCMILPWLSQLCVPSFSRTENGIHISSTSLCIRCIKILRKYIQRSVLLIHDGYELSSSGIPLSINEIMTKLSDLYTAGSNIGYHLEYIKSLVLLFWDSFVSLNLKESNTNSIQAISFSSFLFVASHFLNDLMKLNKSSKSVQAKDLAVNVILLFNFIPNLNNLKYTLSSETLSFVFETLLETLLRTSTLKSLDTNTSAQNYILPLESRCSFAFDQEEGTLEESNELYLCASHSLSYLFALNKDKQTQAIESLFSKFPEIDFIWNLLPAQDVTSSLPTTLEASFVLPAIIKLLNQLLTSHIFEGSYYSKVMHTCLSIWQYLSKSFPCHEKNDFGGYFGPTKNFIAASLLTMIDTTHLKDAKDENTAFSTIFLDFFQLILSLASKLFPKLGFYQFLPEVLRTRLQYQISISLKGSSSVFHSSPLLLVRFYSQWFSFLSGIVFFDHRMSRLSDEVNDNLESYFIEKLDAIEEDCICLFGHFDSYMSKNPSHNSSLVKRRVSLDNQDTNSISSTEFTELIENSSGYKQNKKRRRSLRYAYTYQI